MQNLFPSNLDIKENKINGPIIDFVLWFTTWPRGLFKSEV